MKKIIYAAAAVLLAGFAATPALAAPRDFTGPRIEVTAGVNDVKNARDTDDVTYGAVVGIDAPVGDSFIVGVEAGADNIADRDRTIGVSARVGARLSDSVLAYAKAGYVNFKAIDFSGRDKALDGLRVGGGLEFALNDTLFTKVEYRYSDFSHGVGVHGGVVGLGVRF